MVPHLGMPEIIIILAVALIFFGPKKLPEIGRSIGEGLRELKKASRDIMDTLDSVNDELDGKKESTHNDTNSDRAE